MIPTEDALERWVLEMLSGLGWTHVYGPNVAPDEPGAERDDYREVVLAGRLAAAVRRLNPQLPEASVADVVTTVRRTESPVVESENWNAYRYLTQGVPVEYRNEAGQTRTDRAWLIDWEHPELNDLAAINQFSIEGPKKTRRPDILLFVNGLPLTIFELKRPGKEYAKVQGRSGSCGRAAVRFRTSSSGTRSAWPPTGWKRWRARSPRPGSIGPPGRPSTGCAATHETPTAIVCRPSRY